MAVENFVLDVCRQFYAKNYFRQRIRFPLDMHSADFDHIWDVWSGLVDAEVSVQKDKRHVRDRLIVADLCPGKGFVVGPSLFKLKDKVH